MDQTFMTIHNLGPDANILFASESIADILGYQPSEVQGKSCFDFFHPAEVPFARSVHSRGVLLDKAAVLHYARILASDGRWVGCECCFTIVHDVLVACTSIYRRNAKSQRRAIEAPQIRRIFACSSRDPRYHMLEHLSPKFKMSPAEREPRAALILNRFTRNLTVMFATNAIAAVVGLRPDQIKNKSFYRCIQESCLPEAIKCLESAKANDSIAYLRFCFQDPREDDELEEDGDGDHDHDEDEKAEDDENQQRRGGEVMEMDVDSDNGNGSTTRIKTEEDNDLTALADVPGRSHPAASAQNGTGQPGHPLRLPSIELEAVVSCTSDGLVVILRKARPPIPPAHPPLVAFDYGDGLFAAPWGQQPIRPHFPLDSLCTFRPPLLPQHMPLRDNVKDAGGPPVDVLMGSIRDVAVFAWGVVGINPTMAAYGRGLPTGEARPRDSTYREAHQQTASTRPANDNPQNHSTSAPSPVFSPWPQAADKGKAPAAPTWPYGQGHHVSGDRPGGSSPSAQQPALTTPRHGSFDFQSTWATSGLESYNVGVHHSPPAPFQPQQAYRTGTSPDSFWHVAPVSRETARQQPGHSIPFIQSSRLTPTDSI